MIPVIETIMVKIKTYSRSYAFRAEVQEVVGVLEKIYGASTVEKFPDSQEAVEKLIIVQGSKINYTWSFAKRKRFVKRAKSSRFFARRCKMARSYME